MVGAADAHVKAVQLRAVPERPVCATLQDASHLNCEYWERRSGSLQISASSEVIKRGEMMLVSVLEASGFPWGNALGCGVGILISFAVQ